VGKFSRNAWTKDGRFLLNGHPKWYNYSNSNTSGAYETFEERFQNNFLRLEDDNKPVDWVCGYHYNAVLTAKGEIHCQGYCFWRCFHDDIRHNNENYEDYPFRVDPPEGYKKAVKLFPFIKGQHIGANFQKDDGTVRSFILSEYRWKELTLPEGRLMKKMICPSMFGMSGIDDEGRLYLWQNIYSADNVTQMMPESAEVFANGTNWD